MKSVKAFSSYLSAKQTRKKMSGALTPRRPRTFFYKKKHGPSLSQRLPESVWMTKIGEIVLELCDRKEKVGPRLGPRVPAWVGNIQTRASTGPVANHCAATIAPKGKLRLACYPLTLFLCRPPF